jgi:hypothetical protein
MLGDADHRRQYSHHPRRGSQVRNRLSTGERWIRTLGPPSGQHFFQRPSQNPATTNQPNSRNRILTIDKASFVDQRPRLDLVAAHGGTATHGEIMNLLNNVMGSRRR